MQEPAERQGDRPWGDIGFVTASKYRAAVVRRLAEGPARPTRISEDAGESLSCVSNAISGLRDEGLVELLVPEERRKGRIYGLTDGGEAAAGHIEEAGP